MEKLFPRQLPAALEGIDPNVIINAKRQGETKKLLVDATISEEIESSAPLAEKIYRDLRNMMLSVLQEVSKQEPSARIILDNPFNYQIIGATDLFNVRVGPPACDIQLRIKTKVVPWSKTQPSNENNQIFWQKHMPKDAICFTFALKGGVIQAYNTRYLKGKWVTIRRDGSIYLHPLSASFGPFGNNDLGGSAEGPGVLASMAEVRTFAISVLTNEKYWEYITAAD